MDICSCEPFWTKFISETVRKRSIKIRYLGKTLTRLLIHCVYNVVNTMFLNLTYFQVCHKELCYLFWEQKLCQTNVLGRTHTHGNQQCYHLVPFYLLTRQSPIMQKKNIEISYSLKYNGVQCTVSPQLQMIEYCSNIHTNNVSDLSRTNYICNQCSVYSAVCF